MKRCSISDAGFRRQRGQQGFGAAIDQRIAILHRYRKASANADIARRAGDFSDFGRKIGQSLRAGVMHHHRAGAAERAVGERHGRGEIGVHGGKQREIMQP